MSETDPTFKVSERPVEFTADDGVRLAGLWFEPARGQPSTAVVIVCGAGIPARFYHGLARYLAERGAAVLTFDYRGIGASRAGSLRKLTSGMDDWAVRDIGAALATADAAYPDLPLSAVAHSVGTLLLGAAPGAARLSRSVLLGAHTGYWRDYRAKWRWPLFIVWHAFMPAVTRIVGFFPGRSLGLGEDLPRQVAYDWAGRRRPALVRTLPDGRRFGPHLHRYAEFRAHTLALSISDDAFAPPKAAERLLAMYPSVVASRETVTPASLGRRRLGHFGFVRKGSGEYFWSRIAEWLLLGASTTPREGGIVAKEHTVGDIGSPT
jgi:predicted alpha/beta hydrolase